MLRAGKARKELCLESIEAVSPTLVETLYACKLQAGLSRVGGQSDLYSGIPKLGLGRRTMKYLLSQEGTVAMTLRRFFLLLGTR